MKKIILFSFVFLIGFVNNIYSQKDWSAKLHKVLVTESEGKYSINDFMLIETGKNSLQIKLSATAPTKIIGRDNFVSFYSTYGTIILLAMLSNSGFSVSDLDIKNLDELIGDPDIIINFIIAKNGFQLQLTTNKGTTKKTITWDNVFGDK